MPVQNESGIRTTGGLADPLATFTTIKGGGGNIGGVPALR